MCGYFVGEDETREKMETDNNMIYIGTFLPIYSFI